MTIETYNFNQIIVTLTSDLLTGGKLGINNLVRNGGFGEGDDVISIKFDGKTSKQVGAAGSVQMNRTTDRSGTIAFKFLNISNINNILINFIEDIIPTNLFFNVSILHKSSGRVKNFFGCSIESLPDVDMGLSATPWTWTVLFSDHAWLAV